MFSDSSFKKSKEGFAAPASIQAASSISSDSGTRIITLTRLGPVMGRGRSRSKRLCSSTVPVVSIAFILTKYPIKWLENKPFLDPAGLLARLGCAVICRGIYGLERSKNPDDATNPPRCGIIIVASKAPFWSFVSLIEIVMEACLNQIFVGQDNAPVR